MPIQSQSVGQQIGGTIPEIEPFVPYCARWGFSKAFAYVLHKKGKIRLIKVEGKTYGDNRVALDYLRSCPEVVPTPAKAPPAPTAREHVLASLKPVKLTTV